MHRFRSVRRHWLWSLCLAGCVAASSGAPALAAPEKPGTTAEPSAVELLEDLRLLSLLNTLSPTAEQARQLAAVAQSAREGLANIDEAVAAKLDTQRDRVSSLRARAGRGGVSVPGSDPQVAVALQQAETLRAQRLETLVGTLTIRVRRILTAAQAQQIEDELAPSGDQPWRRYGRVLAGTGAKARSRMPSDPGKWLGELRDLRIDSAEGDPKHEVEDFGRKLTTGLRPGTPLFEQSVAQARAFATQVLAMPPGAFQQQERALAKQVARQELATRNQQNVLDGKPVEVFDPYRWFVEEVILSPRAATDLRDRAAVR